MKPTSTESRIEARGDSRAEPRTDSRVVRIAVVDDHRLVLDGISSHLRAHLGEAEVVICESTWLGLISHQAFPVDLVVLDLNLQDGVPIGPKIRALNSAGSRTVVMSRHADGSSIQSALAAGALAFVPKTESADELVKAVRAALEGTTYLPPAMAQWREPGSAAAEPGLGLREQKAVTLYASGRSMREVAEEMGTTEETIKSYIKRARRKYRAIGVDVGTKVLLRRRGVHDGWFTSD